MTASRGQRRAAPYSRLCQTPAILFVTAILATGFSVGESVASRATKEAPRPAAGQLYAAAGSRSSGAKSTRTVATRKSPSATRSARARGNAEPRVRAPAAVVLDATAGKMLFSKNERVQRPIASITKLMTSIVFLESGASLRERVTVEPADAESASSTALRVGEEIAAGDLFYAALLNSDNVAARCLARASGLTAGEFVERMNRKAQGLGLEDTRFVDPTGLMAENVSTALDVAGLVEAAVRDPFLRSILMTQEYSFRTSRRLHTVHSTNRLLLSTDNLVLGKTGFIQEAGYCFASSCDSGERDLAVVILGARSASARFRETNDLIRWALAREER